MNLFLGIILPFVGTVMGTACVFFMKNDIPEKARKALLGFAAGIMVAASVWSLLIPAMNLWNHAENLSFLPAMVGILLGLFFLLLMSGITSRFCNVSNVLEGEKKGWRKHTMLVLAVTLHNIPEGMAVGVIFAGMLNNHNEITLLSAMALSLGIAIQNFPEGAIVSMPLRNQGESRKKSFSIGVLSGIVEPITAAITLLLAEVISSILPYVLSFAAGAMLYVVAEELIPEASAGKHSKIGTIGFIVGFVLMMIFDVALG